MRTNKMLVVAGIMMLLAACSVRSLHPLYEDKDLVFEPGLLGTWAEKDSETWTFGRSGVNAYELVCTEEGKVTGRLDARLVRLGKHLFLDLYPKDVDESFTVPAHVFVKVRIEGDVLHVAILDPGWLRDALAQGKVRIPHVRLKPDDVLLTASTAELQGFVREHAEDEKAFPPAKLRRKR
ncbi:MAG: hypothetical protein AAB225_04645 [Acidobacteriota bacterium]